MEQYRSLDLYIEKINSGILPIENTETISVIEKTNELIGFGMRMVNGFNTKRIPKELQNKFQNKLEMFTQKYPGYIKKSGENIIFNQRGLLFADQLIPDLFI